MGQASFSGPTRRSKGVNSGYRKSVERVGNGEEVDTYWRETSAVTQPMLSCSIVCAKSSLPCRLAMISIEFAVTSFPPGLG